MPILREMGMTATCYVISEGTEAAARGLPAAIRTSTEGAVQKPCITWRQAEELLREGWEIGAHTATHPKLAEVLDDEGPEAMMDEIERSNESYRANLGFVPDHFAYPSGSRDERTDAMLAPHYRSLRRWTFSSRGGSSRRGQWEHRQHGSRRIFEGDGGPRPGVRPSVEKPIDNTVESVRGTCQDFPC